MSLHQCNHWYLCFCLLSPFCNAVLRPRCRQAAALWFSKSGRTFANIVWISLLLLYSALYLVSLVLTLHFLLFVHKTAFWNHCLDRSTLFSIYLYLFVPIFTQAITTFSTSWIIIQTFANILHHRGCFFWSEFPKGVAFLARTSKKNHPVHLLFLHPAIAHYRRKCTNIIYYNIKGT